jgi:hypothetical protein
MFKRYPNYPPVNLCETTLTRFNSQHKTIKNYIDDLPPGAIYNRLSHDKYSIHETIAYLTRYHFIFLDRLRRILSEVDPFFKLYRPDDDNDYHFAVAKTTGSLLHDLYRTRSDIYMLLNEAKENEYSRCGTHAFLGKMNIHQWLEFFLLHEANQLFRIFKLAGGFWSMANARSAVEDIPGVIYLPGLSYQVDELAG